MNSQTSPVPLRSGRPRGRKQPQAISLLPDDDFTEVKITYASAMSGLSLRHLKEHLQVHRSGVANVVDPREVNAHIRAYFSQAFTVVETLVTLAIIVVLIGIAFAALHGTKTQTEQTSADANAKVLNEAIQYARLKGDTNAVLSGNSVEAVTVYLLQEGYIRNE